MIAKRGAGRAPTARGAAIARALAVLALAALALGAFVLLRGGARNAQGIAPDETVQAREPALDRQDESLDGASKRAAAAEPSAQLAPAAVEEAPSKPVVAERPAAKIVGRCVDRAGLGIEGVALELRGRDEKAASGALGRFELAVEIDRAQTATLVAARDGYGTGAHEVSLRPGETTDVGEILLDRGGALSGWVVDEDGRPVPRATIRVTEAFDVGMGTKFRGPHRSIAEGECDGQGRFRLTDVAAVAIQVWAGADDMRWSTSEPLTLVPGGELTGVELVLSPLEPEDVLEIVVVDPTGEPVPRADVAYIVKTGTLSSMGTLNADEHGRLRKFLEPRAPHSFLATDREKRWRAAYAADVEPGTRELELRLGELAFFELAVVDEEDEPVERFKAILEDPEGRFGWLGGALDEEPREGGLVRLVLPVVPFRVRVEAEGYLMREKEGARLISPQGAEGRRFTVGLRRTTTVRGRVLAGDEPVAGAKVGFHRAANERQVLVVNGLPARSARSADETATTDEKGEFEITPRVWGNFWVRAEATGYPPGDRGPIEIAPNGHSMVSWIRIELEPAGALRGRVLVPPGDDPAGLVVGLTRGDAFGVSQRADAQGRFHFTGLTPGRWLLRQLEREISSSSTFVTSLEVVHGFELPWTCEVFPGETSECDLDSRERPTLAGRLTLSGAPAAGWGAILSSSAGAGADYVTTTLDGDGRFRISASEPGRFRLSLSSPAHATLQLPLELEAGSNEWQRDLEVGRLVGTVLAAELQEHAPVQVSWSLADAATFFASLEPASDGSFVLEQAPLGPGKAYFTTADGSRLRKPIEVVAGAESSVTIP